MTRLIEDRFRPKGRNWPLIMAYLIACGGSTKTTSCTSMATTAALRGYPSTVFDLDANMSTSLVLGWDQTALQGRKSALDLIYGTATLDEVVLPARYRIEGVPAADGEGGDYDDSAFATIPNLRLVPGSVDLAEADTAIAADPDRNDWFAEVLRAYDDEDDVLFIDFPAGYGKMVYSVIRMLDEDDSVIPSFRADPKDVAMVPMLIKELERVRDKNKGRRSVPGRPTINHMLLTGTPTPSYTEAAPRRATEQARAKYEPLLLPFVRYSADAKKLYEDTCPLPILLPNSYPAVDYRKVMTSLGFIERV
ncbi:ParA family protein [Embleya sp. NPDC001921]